MFLKTTKMTWCGAKVVRTSLVGFVLLVQAVSAQDQDGQENAEVQDGLKNALAAANVLKITADDGQEIERMQDEVYLYIDPIRKSLEGSVWVWGTQGRPSALVTLSRNSDVVWFAEVVSFAPQPLQVRGSKLTGKLSLNKLEGQDAPAETAKERKAQLRTIAQKFSGVQMWDNDGRTGMQEYKLRCREKPVLVYEDADNKVLSGAIFLFLYGSNPELALILEATNDGWQYGFGRMGWAAVTVEFDGKKVFEQPKLELGRGDDRYSMVFLPLQ
ncbi:MAG: hypothetical protein KDA87_12235 [Planctomycetales bacterium]|nr:hypothetical protein [Planctomycetales bacterium]